MNEIKSVVLLGCKHCGKSTHGKALANHFNVEFFDTDSVLESIVGMPFREYYRLEGVAKFMEAEEAACKKIIEENPDKQIVVATGGGICDNPPALQYLRSLGQFIFLELDLNFSIQRIMSKIVWDPVNELWINAPAYIQNGNYKTIEDVRKALTIKYTERFEQYRNIADVTAKLKNQEASKNLQVILDCLGKK